MSNDVRRQRMARRAVLPIAVLAAALLSVPSTATGAVEYTQWDLAGDYGDFIIGPTSHSYDASDDLVVTGGAGGVNASVDAGDTWWHLTVAPADGDVLEAGRTYTGATRALYSAPNEPGLNLGGSGRGCNKLTGEFTINEIVVDGEGAVTALNLTFEQHCEGDVAAAYGSLAWHSTLPPVALPPTVPAPPGPSSISVKITPRKVVYGTRVELRAKLRAESAVRTLSIYEKTHSQPRRLIARVDADAGGRLTWPLTITRNARYIVDYDGPGNVPDATRSEWVTAVADIQSDVAHASGKQGQYHLIGKGKRTFFLARVLPKSPKACLSFRAQFFVRGSWGYDGLVDCARLSSKSIGAVYFAWAKPLVGIPIRVRAEWAGNHDSHRARSGWSYLKVVRSRAAARLTDPPGATGAVAIPLPARSLAALDVR